MNGCKCFGAEITPNSISIEAETKAKATLALQKQNRDRKRKGEDAGGSGSSLSMKQIEQRIYDDVINVQSGSNRAFAKRAPLVLWVAMEPDEGLIKSMANWDPVYVRVSQNGGDPSPRVVIAVAELGKAVLSVKKNDIDRSTPGAMIERWESVATGRSKPKEANDTNGPVTGSPFKTVPFSPGIPVNYSPMPMPMSMPMQSIPVRGSGSG